MSALSFQEVVKIGGNKVIVLCFSATESGDRFFHYIKTDRCNLQRMRLDYVERKEVDFSEYGEIIHSGWGEEPGIDDERAVCDKIHSASVAS